MTFSELLKIVLIYIISQIIYALLLRVAMLLSLPISISVFSNNLKTRGILSRVLNGQVIFMTGFYKVNKNWKCDSRNKWDCFLSMKKFIRVCYLIVFFNIFVPW